MSSKPSHIPLFPDAYLRDNYRFSLEQHGLNLLLLMEAWKQHDCTLPDDERALADIAQIKIPKFRAISGPVLANWTREGGRIYQKRLQKEWHWVREKSAKAKAAVAQRRDRSEVYERTTNDLHLGGGGGEGVTTKDEVIDNVRVGPFSLKGGAR